MQLLSRPISSIILKYLCGITILWWPTLDHDRLDFSSYVYPWSGFGNLLYFDFGAHLHMQSLKINLNKKNWYIYAVMCTLETEEYWSTASNRQKYWHLHHISSVFLYCLIVSSQILHNRKADLCFSKLWLQRPFETRLIM